MVKRKKRNLLPEKRKRSAGARVGRRPICSACASTRTHSPEWRVGWTSGASSHARARKQELRCQVHVLRVRRPPLSPRALQQHWGSGVRTHHLQTRTPGCNPIFFSTGTLDLSTKEWALWESCTVSFLCKTPTSNSVSQDESLSRGGEYHLPNTCMIIQALFVHPQGLGNKFWSFRNPWKGLKEVLQ